MFRFACFAVCLALAASFAPAAQAGGCVPVQTLVAPPQNLVGQPSGYTCGQSQQLQQLQQFQAPQQIVAPQFVQANPQYFQTGPLLVQTRRAFPLAVIAVPHRHRR